MPNRSGFDRLLSPFQIGPVKLKNRMVKLSQSMGLATPDGYVSEALFSFYGALARGGVGLIIVEHTFPDYPMGVSGPGRLAISDDKFVPGLTQMVQLIHSQGTPCFVQFGHAGPAQPPAIVSQPPVAASALPRNEAPDPHYPQARELTVSDIAELVGKYAEGARRARDAGFDGVEIHAGHPYLLNSFLSRAWNKRQDAYGGQDPESRARFVVEILQAIKGRLGERFLLGVRINGAEYGITNGITIQESQAIARILEKAGADYLSVSGWGLGPYTNLFLPEQILYPEPTVALAKLIKKPGAFVPLAGAIKKVVSIPIMAAGRLNPVLGERALRQGQADLIGLGRRLFADPELPNKVASGRLEDVAPCTACLECVSRVNAAKLGEKAVIRCRINAALGRENELAVKPAARKKSVVVVGGGPSGMEAARVAALRGHEVTLYEKTPELGGLLPLAALIKGTEVEDLPGIVAYLKGQLSRLGVRVRLGQEVTPALIETLKPDVVVVATGATLTALEIPGDQRKVMSSAALHRSSKTYLRFFGPEVLRWLTRFYLPIGERVVIVGGLMHGCEIAEFLVKRGRKVTIVETSARLGTGMTEMNRQKLLYWLAKKGVFMLTEVTCDRIDDHGLSLITREGERQTIETDTILLATPPVANTGLFDALKGKVPEVYQVGDSREPRTILDAIDDGSSIGRAI